MPIWLRNAPASPASRAPRNEPRNFDALAGTFAVNSAVSAASTTASVIAVPPVPTGVFAPFADQLMFLFIGSLLYLMYGQLGSRMFAAKVSKSISAWTLMLVTGVRSVAVRRR